MKAKKILYGLPFKITAFLLFLILTGVSALCVVGACAMIDQDFYTRSERAVRQDLLSSMVRSDCWNHAHDVVYFIDNGGQTEETNLIYAVYDAAGRVLKTNAEDPTLENWDYEFTFSFDLIAYYSPSEEKIVAQPESVPDWPDWLEDAADENSIDDVCMTVRAALANPMTVSDQYSFVSQWLGTAYSLRYAVFVIGALCALLALVCLILLLCGAGRRFGVEEIVPGSLTRVPFDLLTAVLAIAIFLPLTLVFDGLWYLNDIATAVLLCVWALLSLAAALGWSISFAARIKLGGWWKNTVVFRVLRLALRVLRKIWRGCCAVGRGVKSLFLAIPLVWKTVLVFAALCVIELIGIAATYWEPDNLLVLWFLEKLILAPLVLYAALVLRKLQKGGQALACGDLSYQVDTSKMVWDLKKHGENLNSIAGGMTRAVEERMKSERLKTELITNVSHDIKTPLTSIINYADLIAREPTDNLKITEYCEVLTRQSERLKKLIEDLVEASKASTGNVEVLLAPCEVGVLLTQTAGEYEKRLTESGLTLIVHQPETPVRIMADGRLLWRVFDNLMNNIGKYAQGGTRVYLGLEEMDGEAIVSFKNTSRYELDISSDELLERFVRGDSSRSTEGSGLGLSIAQSLTELQGGAMELTIDGDLFKVTLHFPLIS